VKVCSLGYLAVQSPEAKQWEEFGPEVLGMQQVDGAAADAVYLRMDDRHHRLVIHHGERNRLAHLGWQLANDDDLADAVQELTSAGVTVSEGSDEECAEREVCRMVHVQDPFGTRHELFYGQTSLPSQFLPGRPLQGFVTGEQGVGHVVCVVPQLADAMTFYKRMGFTKTDEIVFPPSHFFACNPRHHSLALLEIPNFAGLHHLMIQLESLDDVGIAYDIVQSRGIPLSMTLGRHANDEMVSFYVRTPAGFELEYGWGGLDVNDTWTTTRHHVPSVWGHSLVATSLPDTIIELT
jgi:extradiol dioxygenase